MATFPEVLAEIRRSALSPAEKGDRFERLILQLFRGDPLYRQEYRRVWLWGDWPDRPHGDLGIDLVAERADGDGYAAIQCKCYEEGASVSKEDVRAFLAASGSKMFTARFFITTGSLGGAPLTQLGAADNPRVSILYSSDLAERDFHWATLEERVDATRHIGEKFTPRADQTEAVRNTLGGLYGQWRVPDEWPGAEPGNREASGRVGDDLCDRGQVLMPCGTGKTFTALQIAEQASLNGGGGRFFRVLYLLPSISLLQQTMREWAEQKSLRLRFVGVCSDVTAGKAKDEIGDFTELEIPVTTDPERIGTALSKPYRGTDMLVTFSTYHSIRLISDAQREAGAPPFDLMFCDEAHRTTGAQVIADRGDHRGTSVFLMPHHDRFVAAKKRVYMTATPKIWSAKSESSYRKAEVFSMDDESQFGPVFYKMKFSEAIDAGLLSDYYLVGLTIDPAWKEKVAGMELHSELTAGEQAKLYGAVKGVSFDENDVPHLRRSISFTNTIKRSLQHQLSMETASERLREMALENNGALPHRVSTEHIDGKTKANIRRQRLDWLKEPEDDECRIVTNARCLSEGVDVPTLDAALFMSPKHSAIDIVQQVGRVMRKAPGKTHGYIVVPIMLAEGDTAQDALRKSEDYATIIKVVRALRSHDDNIDQLINQNRFSEKLRLVPVPASFGDTDTELTTREREEAIQTVLFAPDDLIEAMNVLVFQDCGDRQYWAKWAKDVGEQTIALQNKILTHFSISEPAKKRFDKFMTGIHKTISPNMTAREATGMLTQHLVTKPVFDAFFENYKFSSSNPVSNIMSDVIDEIVAQDLLSNLNQSMMPFYESVQKRIRGITDPITRHEVLKELYETFLTTAFPEETERLGIVYTPVEIVDWLLRSSEEILRQEFDINLSSNDVNIIDPFTGTGTFLTRLIESNLISNEQLEHKYSQELFAIDILPTAYYLSAINIEEAYHGRKMIKENNLIYTPFPGIVWGDTLVQTTDGSSNFQPGMFGMKESNTTVLNTISRKEISVILGNPPWRAGQKSITDENPNPRRQSIYDRVTQTYVNKSTTSLKKGLYDLYLQSLRWASDRIGVKGVIAFVINGGWLDGSAATGVRACLREEFSTIYIYNLRGNARLSGEARRKEGGNVFGGGTRATVVMMVLVKNPSKSTNQIFYKDIGDYLSTKTKLKKVKISTSIKGTNWDTIIPNNRYDWINQTKEAFSEFQPIGDKPTKSRKANTAIFRLYTTGLNSARDLWAYSGNFTELQHRTKAMVEFYNKQISSQNLYPEKNDSIIKWHKSLMDKLRRQSYGHFDYNLIRISAYRPFYPQYLHYDSTFNWAQGQLDKIFPARNTKNLILNISGKGAQKLDAFMTTHTPDFHLTGGGGQVFSRILYLPSESNDMYNGQTWRQRILRHDGESDTRFQSCSPHAGVSALEVPENRGRTARGYL